MAQIFININKQIGIKTFLFPDKQPHVSLKNTVKDGDAVRVVYEDGKFYNQTTLQEIRDTVLKKEAR